MLIKLIHIWRICKVMDPKETCSFYKGYKGTCILKYLFELKRKVEIGMKLFRVPGPIWSQITYFMNITNQTSVLGETGIRSGMEWQMLSTNIYEYNTVN